MFARLGEGQSVFAVIDGVYYHRCPIQLHPDFVTETNHMCNAFVYFMREAEAYQGWRFAVVHGHDWMGAQGRVKTAYGFSWDHLAGQTEGSYRELT